MKSIGKSAEDFEVRQKFWMRHNHPTQQAQKLTLHDSSTRKQGGVGNLLPTLMHIGIKSRGRRIAAPFRMPPRWAATWGQSCPSCLLCATLLAPSVVCFPFRRFSSGRRLSGTEGFFSSLLRGRVRIAPVSAPHDHGHDVFRTADQHRRANSCQRCFFQSIARHSGWAALVVWVLTASFGLL